MDKEKKVCRACASECDKYRSLHKEGYILGEITTLAKLLSFCIDIDFPADESDMPTVMCEKCIPKLAKSFKFKQQVLLANGYLRETEEITEITITDENGEAVVVGVVNNNEPDDELNTSDHITVENEKLTIPTVENEKLSIPTVENEKLSISSAEDEIDIKETILTPTILKSQPENVEVAELELTETNNEHIKETSTNNNNNNEVDKIEVEVKSKTSNCKKDEKKSCHSYVLSMIDGDENNIDVQDCEDEEFISDPEVHPQEESEESDVQSDTAEDKIMRLLPNLKPVKRRKMKTKPIPRPDLKCDVCGKQLSNPNSYRYHMQLHSDEKPYLCSLCGEGFKTRNAYDGHKAIHDPNNPNKCELCGKVYRQASSLRAHMLTHTGQKPFTCKICNKGMTQKSGYKKHMLTHTGEKPHVCDFCGREFRYSSNLIAHRRCHTGEKPYECYTCGKCFISSEQLKRHKVVHTGDRPHKCDICGKKFKRRATLMQHMQVHDSEEVKNTETVKIKEEKTTKSNLIEIY